VKGGGGGGRGEEMKSLRIMIRNSLLIKFGPGAVKMYFDRRVENNLYFIL
jgi:hypothetical protein